MQTGVEYLGTFCKSAPKHDTVIFDILILLVNLSHAAEQNFPLEMDNGVNFKMIHLILECYF